MFDKKKKVVIDSISSVLGESTRLNGKLTFSGTLRIDGNIKGEISAKNQKGVHNTLIVGEKARINGDVHVDTVINSGRITGNVYAKSRVAIHDPGQLTGDVQTSEFTVEDGVVFNGRCNMVR